MYAGHSCHVSDALCTPMNDPPFAIQVSRDSRNGTGKSPVVFTNITTFAL